METKFKPGDIITHRGYRPGDKNRLKLMITKIKHERLYDLLVLESGGTPLTKGIPILDISMRTIEDYIIVGQMDEDMARVLYEN